jgi:Ras-related GTP-binding protein A/B
VISHSISKYEDVHRFEKVSNIIKQFKLSCSKSQASLHAMEIRDRGMSLFVQPLTINTFIMVVLQDPNIQPAIINMNIQKAKKHFEVLEET